MCILYLENVIWKSTGLWKLQTGLNLPRNSYVDVILTNAFDSLIHSVNKSSILGYFPVIPFQ